MTTRSKKSLAYVPAEWELADASALQALHHGEANADQQQRALRWIIEAASNINDLTWRPGGLEGERESSFAEGRRFVGLQIKKLIFADIAKLRRKDNG